MLMKRLLSLFVLCSLVFVACERESIIRPQRTINVGFEYGEYIIPDTSPELWNAISKNTWIEIISTPLATVAKELRFAVARNESDGVRKGRIILQNGQDGSCVEISIVQGAYVRDANGHQCVDLGLSVDWAVVNIGANTLVDYGDYFAWGEVSTKECYDGCVTFDVPMLDIAGNLYYDAATANCGGTWRMPTSAEMEELITYCSWEWTSMYDVKGVLVTGPNGNSIFLPAAGYCTTTVTNDIGKCGYYWSSTPYDNPMPIPAYDENYYAIDLYFHSGQRDVANGFRSIGLPIRPVIK